MPHVSDLTENDEPALLNETRARARQETGGAVPRLALGDESSLEFTELTIGHEDTSWLWTPVNSHRASVMDWKDG